MLFEIELRKFDWGQLECGCGERAAHLPAGIVELVTLDPGHGRGEAFNTPLHDHVMTGAGGLVSSSPAFLSVAMAALTGSLSAPARREILGSILRILGTATSVETVSEEEGVLAAECVYVVRQGQWLLYAEVVNAASPAGMAYAFEALMLIEHDRKRLRAVRDAVAGDLPWDIKEEEI